MHCYDHSSAEKYAAVSRSIITAVLWYFGDVIGLKVVIRRTHLSPLWFHFLLSLISCFRRDSVTYMLEERAQHQLTCWRPLIIILIHSVSIIIIYIHSTGSSQKTSAIWVLCDSNFFCSTIFSRTRFLYLGVVPPPKWLVGKTGRIIIPVVILTHLIGLVACWCRLPCMNEILLLQINVNIC